MHAAVCIFALLLWNDTKPIEYNGNPTIAIANFAMIKIHRFLEICNKLLHNAANIIYQTTQMLCMIQRKQNASIQRLLIRFANM